MFRHVVLLTWIPEATAAQRRTVLDALATLPAAIPEIRDYRFGEDAGLAESNASLAVVADFDDAAAYQVYATHPEHVRVIAEHIRPILASRTAAQYELR